MGACAGKLSSKKDAAKDKAADAAPMTKTILITGASGNVGKATIAALAKYPDITVKAGVRDPEKSKDLAVGAKNVSVVAADPLNAEQIGEALKGVDAVFVVTPGHIDRAKIANAAVDAAKAAGVKHVVVVSVLTADLTDTIFGKQFTEIEGHVKVAGVPYTLLRLPLFLDNQYGNIGSIKEQGTWYDAIEPEKPFTPSVVQDIAEVAAKILSAPAPHANKTYMIASPADTYANLAKYYSEAIGKPVTYTPVPYEGVKAALTGMGFQEWQADGILDLEKLINSDSPVTNEPQGAKDVEAILGRPPMTFKAWVEANAAAFK